MADEYSGASQEPIKVYENTYIMKPSEAQRWATAQTRRRRHACSWKGASTDSACGLLLVQAWCLCRRSVLCLRLRTSGCSPRAPRF